MDVWFEYTKFYIVLQTHAITNYMKMEWQRNKCTYNWLPFYAFILSTNQSQLYSQIIIFVIIILIGNILSKESKTTYLLLLIF